MGACGGGGGRRFIFSCGQTLVITFTHSLFSLVVVAFNTKLDSFTAPKGREQTTSDVMNRAAS